ncbi:MAG: response regulator transcription factor [Bacteroidetes bacterium]|nr:response regulator transcription factor [Bacteroidota bacterium]
MTKRILLVEDEDSLREAVKMNLDLEKYEVTEATTGTAALRYVNNGVFDLIILDVMLPEMNGFDICEKIRLKDKHTPILFLTAKGAGKDRVEGLKRGADDYLVKPFNLEEFMLRVKVLVKRSVQNQSTEEPLKIYTFGKNEINFTTQKAIGNRGKQVELTIRETELLNFLIVKKGKVVSRQQILNFVWGYKDFPSTRTIDNFILSFRSYFEADPRNPKYFLSVHGVGYKFLDK